VFDYFADSLGIAAECRRFDDFAGTETNVRQTETLAHEKTIAECALYVVRTSIRSDIEILWSSAKKKVSDSTSDKIRHITQT
jgi:hypothetical protein